MMKNKLTILLAIAACNFTSHAIAADSCSGSAQESHQEKFERFMINEVPSLLEACGLGGLIIEMPSLPSFGADLFCGFGTNDLSDFYGEYSSTGSSGFSGRSSSTPTRSITNNTSPSTVNGNRKVNSQPPKATPPVHNSSEEESTKWQPADLFKKNK
jgi:hypothetical protein